MRQKLAISIHALLAESDYDTYAKVLRVNISIHALLAESDHRFRSWLIPHDNFYPRSPCGERHPGTSVFRGWTLFLSTLSLRRATFGRCLYWGLNKISIHALLAESDCRTKHSTNPKNHFYPRSPCGERLVDALKLTDTVLFLSTLSLRRATILFAKKDRQSNISIHALLAESDSGRPETHRYGAISIHALLAESDAADISVKREASISIHALLAESDTQDPQTYHQCQISIHALLAESDGYQRPSGRPTTNFYPRSPCGERPTTIITICIVPRFLSTLSLRRATPKSFRGCRCSANFYPRSPCGERPSYSQHVTRPSGYFYPRSPCGERPTSLVVIGTNCVISIHALLAESDGIKGYHSKGLQIFLSTLSLRRATPRGWFLLS